MYLVSIIIPSFNRASLIGETLDSIVAQTYQEWECIVVDDSSSDFTKELLEFYQKREKRIKYTLNRHSKGAPGARNTGLCQSTGNFVIFLDSDDIFTPNCLEKRINYFKKYSNYDFLIFQSHLFFKEIGDSELVPNILFKDTDDISRFIKFDYPWNTSSVIFKKEFLKKNGILWCEYLLIHQDLDFYITILAEKPQYKKVIDYPDVYIRMEGSGKLTFSTPSTLILTSKYLFLRNVFRQLKSKNLVEKYQFELYGLGFFYNQDFFKYSCYKLYMKTLALFLQYRLHSFSFYLIFDHLYYKSFKIDQNKLIRKLRSIYKKFNLDKRTQYVPPKGSTLGKLTITQHLKNLV